MFCGNFLSLDVGLLLIMIEGHNRSIAGG